MTALEQFAAMLNGRQYREEITKAECEIAKSHNLVVAFGASDDLLEFRGAINDEISAYDGVEAFIVGKVLTSADEDFHSDCEVFKKYQVPMPAMIRVESIWCPKEPDASWLVKTDVPNACSFDIFEDDELYCRGVVFQLSGN